MSISIVQIMLFAILIYIAESTDYHVLVSKMLVDHLLDFKGCSAKDHDEIQYRQIDNRMSISQFVARRQFIINELGEDGLPDFAQNDRLPHKARVQRCYETESQIQTDDVKDEWRKHCRRPLSHVTATKWDEHWDFFEAIFTEEPDRSNLCLWHEDDVASKSNRCYDCQFAEGEVTLDIDSILAMFTDLSVINAPIRFSIMSNPAKNLQHNVHLACRGIPLHHVPHFYLGTFGHDPHFDLFLMLPALYNSKAKRSNRNLYNHVAGNIRRAFMTHYLIPSVKEVLDPNERQSWQFDYDIAEANSTAMTKEGNQYVTSQAQGRFFEVHADLGAEYIEQVWSKCERRLRRRIELEDDELQCFEGFEFFINAKGFKYRMNSQRWGDLMKIYKNRVKPLSRK